MFGHPVSFERGAEPDRQGRRQADPGVPLDAEQQDHGEEMENGAGSCSGRNTSPGAAVLGGAGAVSADAGRRAEGGGGVVGQAERAGGLSRRSPRSPSWSTRAPARRCRQVQAGAGHFPGGAGQAGRGAGGGDRDRRHAVRRHRGRRAGMPAIGVLSGGFTEADLREAGCWPCIRGPARSSGPLRAVRWPRPPPRGRASTTPAAFAEADRRRAVAPGAGAETHLVAILEEAADLAGWQRDRGRPPLVISNRLPLPSGAEIVPVPNRSPGRRFRSLSLAWWASSCAGVQ